MTESVAQLSKGALSDLAGVFEAMPEKALDGLIEAIVAARRIIVFGLGRKGLQMRGFAMRLFHMGRDVAVWGDMTTPALGRGRSLHCFRGTRRSPDRANAGRGRAQGWSPHCARRRSTWRWTRKTRRYCHGHSRPDDGQRSGRQAFRLADGLPV
jgi:hypothetical protein